MKSAFTFLLLILAMALAGAQNTVPPLPAPPQPEAEAAVRQLYVCHDFYESGTRSTDKALQDQSAQLSMQSAFKATVTAVDMGDPTLSSRLADEANVEYVHWLATLRALTEDERGKRLEEFQAHCINLMDRPIPHEASDRSPQQASTLYFCADANHMLAERALADERDRRAAHSTELRAKADAVASRNGQRAIDPALAHDGQARADAWVANLDAVASDSRKAALLKKFELICTRAANRL